MPAMITHLLCGQAVLRKIEPKVTNAIEKHRKLYDIGTQGPDMFFYRSRGRTAGLGSRMHGEHVGDFLSQMAAGLKKLDEDDKNAAFAYFSGFLTHYALDCASHPYIYYKTGFDEQGKLSGVYNVYHLTFESAIDTLLLKHLQGKSPIDEKWWKRISSSRQAARQAAGLVARSANLAYTTDLKERHVLSAMATMALATRFLRSRWGHWRGLVGFVENIVTGDGMWTALIHRQDIGDGIDYLNKAKEKWKEPWDVNSARHEAFRELFDVAIKDAAKMIAALWSYLQNQMPHDKLIKILGDRSFNSGRPISDNIVFKVHDIVFRTR